MRLQCIAIDFAYAFGFALQALPVPEISPFRLSPCLLRVVGPPGARDYALLQSSLFHLLKSTQGATKGPPAHRHTSAGAEPTHPWVAGTLGLFESYFADALDFVRNHRLVVEAVVEMFVREPLAVYREVRHAVRRIRFYMGAEQEQLCYTAVWQQHYSGAGLSVFVRCVLLAFPKGRWTEGCEVEGAGSRAASRPLPPDRHTAGRRCGRGGHP